jgi:hypothetical protein
MVIKINNNKMKHIKLFENWERSSEDYDLSSILSDLDIDYTIGKDHVGNEGVFLFNHNEYSFEVYPISNNFSHEEGSELPANICYFKNGKFIKDFKTSDVKYSLQEIFNK